MAKLTRVVLYHSKQGVVTPIGPVLTTATAVKVYGQAVKGI